MKTFILGFLAICLTLNLNAQKYVGAKPQTPIKPTRSIPKFLESEKLTYDLSNLKALKDIYQRLKKEKIGMVYNYDFYIDTLGKITLSRPETSPYMVSLNKYVETIFKKYKWAPSHKLNCRRCLLRSSAYLEVMFRPEDNEILIYLGVVEDNGNHVFSQTIYMK